MELTNRLLTGIALGIVPALVFALPVTLASPSSSFSDATGGTDINYSTSGNHSEVHWGKATTKNPGANSGLSFDTFDSSLSANTGEPFGLGTLTHFNWEVKNGTAATGVYLHFAFTTTSPDLGSIDFLFPLAIDETDNTAPCAEVATPSSNHCPDIITFANPTSTRIFNVGGVDYTLSILGFGPDANGISDRFITQEGQANTTRLWARIDMMNVPEPGTLVLMLPGLLVLGGVLQLRRKRQDEA